MISVSEAFKATMRQPIKAVRMHVTTNEQEPRTFDASDVLATVEIESTGYYFGTVTKSLTMKLIGTDYDLRGVGVTPTLEAQLDAAEDTWDSLSYGLFTITEQTADLEKGTTTFKGYDVIGVAANKFYVAGDLEWGCTVAELATQVANKLDIALATDITALANHDYTIREDLYAKISNTNYRNILSEIAGATATICRINNDKLEFIKPPISEFSDTLSYDNLIKAKLLPDYGPINSVVLSRTPQEDNIVITDEESISEHGLTELKLANNEILDDDRELLATPILDTVDGFSFTPIEATTEGHGWYECGDRVRITDGTNNWDTIITYIKLAFSGGIKETIKSVTPNDTQTNYALAGGVTRTIYNTEIKVDKQNQVIESVVSEVEELEGRSTENYTQIIQNITNITNTIQNTGGSNLLYNSVGYATDTRQVPTVWQLAGTVTAYTSPESLTFGAKSGNQINMSASSSISQTITTAAEEPISLSARIRKGTVGSATIEIAAENGNSATIEIADQKEYLWEEVSIPAFLPSSSTVTVTITTDENVGSFAITDLMLVSGDHTTVWQQASGEILNANVLIDKDGVVVKNNVYAGDYVQITPLEFAGYSSVTGSQAKVFSLNRDTTQVQKLAAVGLISMPPLKIIPLTDSKRAGWAFVKGDK